jgi:hypothetical protein
MMCVCVCVLAAATSELPVSLHVSVFLVFVRAD